MTGEPKNGRHLCRGPVRIGAFFAALAIILTLIGLWRQDNLSLRSILLAVFLCGGGWGLVSWAIATAAVHVEEDVASRRDQSG